MLANVFRNLSLAVIAAHLLIVPATAEDERLRVIKTQSFKSMIGEPRVDQGLVVFTKYNDDGNTQDVIAIDPKDGSALTLVTGARDAKYIAANDRYVVYGTREHGFIGSLIVADRNTGQRLAKVRLRDSFVWGHIEGERLIVIQAATGGRGSALTAPALVYRLPTLQLERSTTIAGGHEVQLWDDKIVVLGHQLTVYDFDLNKLGSADFPARDPKIRSSCNAHSLRIYGDQAILSPNCRQIAVYDLLALQIVRLIPGFATFHTFDVIDKLIFAAGEENGVQHDGRVFEIASGREVARLKLRAGLIAVRGGNLLGIERGFAAPIVSTVYEPDLAAIRSDTGRLERVLAVCAAKASADGDVRNDYQAIDECEAAGIKSYIDDDPFRTELKTSIGNYAEWLASTLPRYEEAIPILERLGQSSRNDRLLAIARRKLLYLRTSDESLPTAIAKPIPGVRKQAIDFGFFSTLIEFKGNRAYVARYGCARSDAPGVTLDVVDRESFALIKRVPVAGCDDEYQDNISSIHLLPDYVVLGLAYRYDDPRTNVVVVDSDSLEVVARGIIAVDPISLVEWRGRLLRCATVLGEPHTRLEPATARLAAATEEEAIACLNGDATGGPSTDSGSSTAGRQRSAIPTTPNYQAFEGVTNRSLRFYRFVALRDGAVNTRTTERQYISIDVIPQRDAVVLSYLKGQERCFSRFDISAQTESTLFCLPQEVTSIASANWRNFLLVAMDRNLLVYDLEREIFARYEKEFIREGLEPICPSCNDRNGIRRLLLDNDQLIVLTLDGANSRIINLPAYVAGFTGTDFFEAESQPEMK